MSSPIFVYRIYDSSGGLLYVGASKNVHSRITTHKRSKVWAPEIASVSVSGPFSLEESAMQEGLAIKNEAPKHNKNSRSVVREKDNFRSAAVLAKMQALVDYARKIAQKYQSQPGQSNPGPPTERTEASSPS